MIHLIQSPKQNNTLNIISKQNESLPVLTIPNPQSHENYSSQIVQVNSTDISMNVTAQQKEDKSHEDEQNSLMQEGTSHVIQVVQYHQHDSDDREDFVCGICDEDFEDKNTLKKHIKVHI
jgi:stress-induced morphogen